MKKKYIALFLTVFLVYQVEATTPTNDVLVQLHSVTTVEMNAIASPVQGSLIFNTDDSEVYERNATRWNRVSSDGSETKVIEGSCTSITGVGTPSNPYVVNKAILGKTKATAGESCMQLVNTGCVFDDGMYWINPDGGSTANAFEVYCDMTTDGGGWTRIEYTNDLTHQRHFTSDGNKWLPNNFVLNITDTQINNIRAVSTEGKQFYHSTCQGVLTYLHQTNNYVDAFGFRFHTGDETSHGQLSYPGTNINVLTDGCKHNDAILRATDFEIIDIRVPVINVHSKDNGHSGEKFGSPLTSNPAWLR